MSLDVRFTGRAKLASRASCTVQLLDTRPPLQVQLSVYAPVLLVAGRSTDVNDPDELMAKLATTVRSALRSSMQLAPLVESQPVQPANAEPEDAVAASVTEVPAGCCAVQIAPQVMPPPLTTPAPRPPF